MGFGLRKKPKDLSAHKREEHDHGQGRDVYATLLQSVTVQSYGRAKADTRPVVVEMRKQPQDLSASEREERGYGKLWIQRERFF